MTPNQQTIVDDFFLSFGAYSKEHDAITNLVERVNASALKRIEGLESELTAARRELAEAREECTEWQKSANALAETLGEARERDMNSLQTEVGMWQDRTFPAKTNSSIIEHLSREVAELKRAGQNHALVRNELSFKEMCVELADVCMLSFGLAHHLNVLLSDVTREKLEINKKRKWGTPDAQGVVEHITEPTGEKQ